MNNKFIDEVTKHINNKTAKQSIEAELTSHILDKIDFYVDIGYTKEQAEEMATEEMGDPEQTAVPLNSLHNIKWYNLWENRITLGIIFIVFIFISLFLDRFMYGAEYLTTTHYISIDLISFFILIFSLTLIHFARKRKNKVIDLGISVFIFFQLFMGTFQPLFFGLVNIISGGFSSYRDNIFSYSSPSLEQKGYYNTLSAVTVVILLIYCGFVFWGIYMQERGKTQKNFWKPYKILERASAVLISVCMIITAMFTVTAYSEVNRIKAENKKAKEAEVAFILNTDTTKGISKVLKSAYDYEDINFEPLYNSDVVNYEYRKNNTRLIFRVDNLDKSIMYAEYEITNPYDNFCLLNDDLYITESEIEEYKKRLFYQDPDTHGLGVTHGFFQSSYSADVWTASEYTFPVYMKDCKLVTDGEYTQKITSIYKTPLVGLDYIEYDTLQPKESTTVEFLLKDSKYEYVSVIFEDDRLDEIRLWYKN